MTATEERTGSHRTNWFVEMYRSDLGKKYAMAISGIVGLGYIFVHMIGNLHMFEGPDQIEHYAEGLRSLGEPILPHSLLLWLLRLPLIIALVVHVHAAYGLTRSNQKARSTPYDAERKYLAASYASRTMRWTGVILLLFLAWHLADLTWGIRAVNPEFVRGAVYENVVASLERWPVTILYLVAMGALGFHVWHGAWSMFQSLGVNNPRFNAFRRTFATAFAIIVVAGFVAVPIGVQLGILG